MEGGKQEEEKKNHPKDGNHIQNSPQKTQDMVCGRIFNNVRTRHRNYDDYNDSPNDTDDTDDTNDTNDNDDSHR